MALDQSALLDLLEALKLAEVDDRVRSATETLFQALIDAELTAVIGAAPHQRTDTHRTAQPLEPQRLLPPVVAPADPTGSSPFAGRGPRNGELGQGHGGSVDRVDGIDVDTSVIETAASARPCAGKVSFEVRGLADLPAAPAYDIVTAVPSSTTCRWTPC